MGEIKFLKNYISPSRFNGNGCEIAEGEFQDTSPLRNPPEIYTRPPPLVLQSGKSSLFFCSSHEFRVEFSAHPLLSKYQNKKK